MRSQNMSATLCALVVFWARLMLIAWVSKGIDLFRDTARVLCTMKLGRQHVLSEPSDIQLLTSLIVVFAVGAIDV